MPNRHLFALAAVATALLLSVASCSQSDAIGGATTTTFPVYTPTAGPGDPAGASSGRSADSIAGSPSMTSSSAPPVSESATAGDPATTTGLVPDGTTPATTVTAATTGSTITVLPTKPTVTLAPSLVVSMTVAPGVDTSGVDIEGAKAAYYGFLSVGDRAVADPTQDWREEFAKYAVEPVLSAVVAEIQELASMEVRSVGHSIFLASATSIEPNKVQLRVCNDVSGVDRVNVSDGASVGAASGDRHPQDVSVTRSGNSHWFVSNVIPHFDATC